MLPNDYKKIDIPEYYRQFQPKLKEEKPIDKSKQLQPDQNKDLKQENQAQDKTVLFRGNTFTLNQLEDWEDKTIYTLTGPVTDGIQHNLLITIEKDNPFDNVIEYAEWHIKTIETDLKGCTLLKKGKVKLSNGLDAYEAIFSWYPTDELRIYQHQIFVQSGRIVYKLTASFTKKTRQILGPQIERMMLSFNPCISK